MPNWRRCSPSSGFETVKAIETANAEALRRILTADPVLVDCRPASELIPALADGQIILHAGPPISWDRMCGPMRGAVMGIAVFEGWATDLTDAEAKAAAGTFTFAPNHHYDCVGPMTGMTTKSQPLLVVENRAFGNRAYCAINEGLGKVMRFGGNDAEVLTRLAWLRDVCGPALGRSLQETGGIALKALVSSPISFLDCTGMCWLRSPFSILRTATVKRSIGPRIAVRPIEWIPSPCAATDEARPHDRVRRRPGRPLLRGDDTARRRPRRQLRRSCHWSRRRR